MEENKPSFTCESFEIALAQIDVPTLDPELLPSHRRSPFEIKFLRAASAFETGPRESTLLYLQQDTHPPSSLQLQRLRYQARYKKSTIFSCIANEMESHYDDEKVQLEFIVAYLDECTIEENENLFTETFMYAKYAILSHPWFHDPSVAAIEHGATLDWMDTICTNKESNAELDESIRSIFSWYQDASVCITYLAQTTTLELTRADPWFTRDWTLQGLLAPEEIEFYGADWKKLGAELTNVERTRLLPTGTHIPTFQKMKWATNQQVTREEDVAYSLMGIFNVTLSIAYGEGPGKGFPTAYEGNSEAARSEHSRFFELEKRT
ncbi:hypothetical protein BDN70DRAFT_898832 [Pholiota conissans]|uniref:Heterokaryon incompatibility domain-containing protein n=1 Tax=Pholiota conissans TaxID=109636 RepID=A0A9P5YVD1_9AGAR|nr:hypothetical protein BDN70DRAFT_898832 [Pholiota conissans]